MGGFTHCCCISAINCRENIRRGDITSQKFCWWWNLSSFFYLHLALWKRTMIKPNHGKPGVWKLGGNIPACILMRGHSGQGYGCFPLPATPDLLLLLLFHASLVKQGWRDTTGERLKSSSYMLLKWVNVSLEEVKVVIRWRETCVSLKTVLTHLAGRGMDLTWFRSCISISGRMHPGASAHWPDVSCSACNGLLMYLTA